MNRLYVIESTMTATGGKSDHRLALRYSEIESFAGELAAALGVQGGGSQNFSYWTSRLATDLQSHKGACAIIPGETQSPAVHALAHAMNAALGNVGKTVIYTDPLEVHPVDQVASLRQLAHDMNNGEVELLMIMGGNPAYNAPFDLEFSKGLERVKTSIHTGLHFDRQQYGRYLLQPSSCTTAANSATNSPPERACRPLLRLRRSPPSPLPRI